MSALLRIVEGTDPRQWDAFVRSHPHSTFCHRWGWKAIMEDVLGHEALYLAAVGESGEIRGVMPLVRVRSILGHYLISLPFLNDGGPLGNPEARKALAEDALKRAETSGADLLELRARVEVEGSLTPAYRKVAVHLELPASVDGLWKTTLRPKVRSQIRRPQKEGMIFRRGKGEIDAFYRVFARNMRDLGTPVLPRAFFTGLAQTFDQSVWFGAVYTADGRPVAAACCLHWRDEVEVTWASSLREYNRQAPNMLLYASLMQEAIASQIRVFNFGRCTAGGSTHRFKQQWGGVDVPLPWPTWSRQAGAGVPTSEGRFFRVAVAAWKQLPIGVANRVGPLFARLLP